MLWAYLHSDFCGGLRNTHLFCNRVRIGRSRSLKAVDFSTNRKGACHLLLVINSYILWSYLAPFLRYGDLLAENCDFFLPHSYLTPSLGVNPVEFLDKLVIAKTRVLGLSVSKDFVILACVFLTQYQRVTDGQTDRHSDRSYSALHSKLC